MMINVNVGFMYVVGFSLWIEGQDEDSCGKSGTGETPQERKRGGDSAAARGKRSLARKSTAV
ncbi:hypothetical protein B1R96_11255 [Priestia aryabhattai]|uniref:hypothetical protein n=1 Tax=Priestia aryabhattai TaxID=412384 RepID=UPI000B4550E9|nr:hypothetical protein [Priestia aryabhattai]OUT31191.1 hypothetical protein B1R96_11255 [Priestia aryabhattai]